MSEHAHNTPATPNTSIPRVFISSTYLDNKERRRIVLEAVARSGMEAVAMERFAAKTRPAKDECLRLASEADLFLGILAWKYGWIPDDETRSITELEFDAATASGVDRLMFVLKPPMDPESDCDPGPDRWKKQDKLQAFKDRLSSDVTPVPFQDNELGMVVMQKGIHFIQSNLCLVQSTMIPSNAFMGMAVTLALMEMMFS